MAPVKLNLTNSRNFWRAVQVMKMRMMTKTVMATTESEQVLKRFMYNLAEETWKRRVVTDMQSCGSIDCAQARLKQQDNLRLTNKFEYCLVVQALAY